MLLIGIYYTYLICELLFQAYLSLSLHSVLSLKESQSILHGLYFSASDIGSRHKEVKKLLRRVCLNKDESGVRLAHQPRRQLPSPQSLQRY